MNRYLEHDGKKCGLKSQDCAKVLKAVEGYIPDNWESAFRQVTGALQAADYIALAEKHAPYTAAPRVFIYEQLDRYKNEWFTIPRGRWLQLYNEENKRVCNARTYGPTLRIKYPCGFVGFKGIPAETKADKAPEPTPETKKNTDQVNAVLGLWANSAQRLGFVGANRVYGLVNKPKRDFGVTQTPKRAATDDRTSQYLDVCGRGKRHRVSDIKIEFVLDEHSSDRYRKELEQTKAKLDEIDRQLNKRFPTLVVGPTPFAYFRYNKDLNEWEQTLGTAKPESLDPKACRQFVEQLLAFDELEKKRKKDLKRLVRHLQEIDEISHKSYCWLLEGLIK